MLHSKSKVPAKAVLIGINYRAWPYAALNACWADIEEAERFLLKIGMDPNDIRIVSDKKNKLAPTKKAILDAFKWLKHGALDGDVLYIHYSGHGTEGEPPYDNPLGRISSKAICPIDLFHNDVSQIDEEWPDYDDLSMVNSITGADFHRIFGHLEESQINLTVVYDCCHSTGAMRSLSKVTPKTSIRGLIVPASMKLHRKVSKKVKEIEDYLEEQGSWGKDLGQRYAISELHPPYVIGFAAADCWEAAEEAEIATKQRGVFSYFFYKLLNSDAKNINGQGIIESVKAVLSKYDFEQHATLTTVNKLEPFLVDFTKTNKTINYAELSDPRLINTEVVYKNYENERDRKKLLKTHKKFQFNLKEDGELYKTGLGPAPLTPIPPMSEAYTELARSNVRQIVSVYAQISAHPELLALRDREKRLFDSLIRHAIPYCLQAASCAVKATANIVELGHKDIGSEYAIQQHLPTAINFAQQVMSLPELQQEQRVYNQKFFTTCMPIVLETARQFITAKKGMENLPSEASEAQSGLFDALIGKLPSTAMNAVSDAAGTSTFVDEDDRFFFENLKRVAPVALNVAYTTANSVAGERSLSFAPTDRVFFENLRNVVNKAILHPAVQKCANAALNIGVELATNPLAPQKDQRAIEAPSGEYAEAHVRTFFGCMIQCIMPIAIDALKCVALGMPKHSIIVPPPELGVFDHVSEALPRMILLAQQQFNQNRSFAATPDEEAKFLTRLLTNAAAPITQAALKQNNDAARAIGINPRDVLSVSLGH